LYQPLISSPFVLYLDDGWFPGVGDDGKSRQHKGCSVSIYHFGY
jgi:hypothetical protein